MTESTTPTTSVDQLLGNDRPPRWWRRPALWVALLLIAALAAGWWWWNGRQAARVLARAVIDCENAVVG